MHSAEGNADFQLCMQVTTIAWKEDKELLCHAHKKGVKIVVHSDFEHFDDICIEGARRKWIMVRLHS